MTYQYFSKWRKEWIDFGNQPPGEGEVSEFKRYKYEMRVLDSNGNILIIN